MQDSKLKPFEKVYDLKLYILMLERLRCGMEFVEEQFEYYRSHNPEPETLEELIEEIEDFTKNWVCEYIPDDVCSMWLSKQHTAFTNEFHFRKEWNEIENDKVTSYYLNRLFEMISVATVATSKTVYAIRIHDFNDVEVFFNTEIGAEGFVETYGVDIATLIKRDKDGNVIASKSI